MIDRFELADASRVNRLLDRIARELAVFVDSDWVVVGVRRRGVPLAERLGERLDELLSEAPEKTELELKRYSDELEILHHRPQLEEKAFDLDVEDRSIVLVDDVLFTGRTLHRAVEFLIRRGADRVEPVVLCRRGTPEIPVRTAACGVRLDVGEERLVEVEIPPYEEKLGVFIRSRPAQ